MISSRTPGPRPGLRGLARWTALAGLVLSGSAFASEAELQLPDLSKVTFLGGTNGRSLLMWGLLICLFGFGFGVYQFSQLRKLPVHKAMLEISELIYETCKTYLVTQGKFILALEVLIGAVMVLYFGVLQHMDVVKVVTILAFSLIGIAGSYGVAWFGIRVNTFANSRTAFASLRGKPFPVYAIPLRAGMSIGMALISTELLIMLCILLFVPADFAGPCFIGFAIGESLGASALRIAGGIFTKIADIGSDLMKIVFKIKEDDARNPGVIADCTGDNAGDSVGPSADGFETYGVTGVALITFILLAAHNPTVQVQLLVWMFVMRVVMIIASFLSYVINEAVQTARYKNADQDELRGPAHRAGVADLAGLGGPDLHRQLPDHRRPGRRQLLVEALGDHHLRHAGRGDHPRGGQGLHLHRVQPRARGGHRLARGRRLAERHLRPGGGQLQRLLDGHRHRRPDGHRLRAVHPGPRRRCSRWRGATSTPRRCSPSAWWPSASWAWAR